MNIYSRLSARQTGRMGQAALVCQETIRRRPNRILPPGRQCQLESGASSPFGLHGAPVRRGGPRRRNLSAGPSIGCGLRLAACWRHCAIRGRRVCAGNRQPPRPAAAWQLLVWAERRARKLHWTRPGPAEPNRTEPNRTEPDWTKPNRTEPNRTS